ncbi:MAG: TIGR03032 family protein [Rhodospirillales bacterium]
MAEQNLSIAFSTYQSAKVFMIGLQPTGRLSIFERTFNRCMGLCLDRDSLYLSSLYQLWRFENVLAPGQVHDGYDRLYVPMDGRTTGDLDIHDIAIDRDGRVIFVNTLFSCLATIGDKTSFQPLWKPRFISKLAAEDRCHLNGLAMQDGKPAYVTAVGQTDVPNGWRDKRRDGGCLIDVSSGEIVIGDLSMPHSPRVYNGKVWLLNSGTGEFGSVDVTSGRFEPMTFCPGYARGLSFHGDYALVGLSKPRENRTFSGLALDDTMRTKNATAQCGIYVIDIRSGDVVHWLTIDGIVTELYDVVCLPNVRRPMALGFKSDEIRRTISMSDMGSL